MGYQPMSEVSVREKDRGLVAHATKNRDADDSAAPLRCKIGEERVGQGENVGAALAAVELCTTVKRYGG